MKRVHDVELFDVYDHPRDYPGHFVVRRRVVRSWGVADPTDDFAFADTLEAVREEVPRGLHRVPRQPGEDPAIVETWL